MSTAPQNAAPDPTEAAKPGRPRVLVVDDEPAVLRLLKVLLIRHGYEVETAGGAKEALKVLDKSKFDLVITDAVMPNVTGYDLVKAIRRRTYAAKSTDQAPPDVPVLMLTRKKERADVKLALEAGVTDYALKPIDEHLIMDKIELCLVKVGAKRHVYDCPVTEESSASSLEFRTQVVAISEADITIRLPMEIHLEQSFDFNWPIYADIGIDPPLLRLSSCEKLAEPQGKLTHEARFAFTGVLESELKKIRVWLHRETLKRRK